MRAPRERYYSSYSDDFVTTRGQDLRLPGDYEWIRHGARSRVISALSYSTVLLLSSIGCRSAMCFSRRSRRFRAAYIR